MVAVHLSARLHSCSTAAQQQLPGHPRIQTSRVDGKGGSSKCTQWKQATLARAHDKKWCTTCSTPICGATSAAWLPPPCEALGRFKAGRRLEPPQPGQLLGRRSHSEQQAPVGCKRLHMTPVGSVCACTHADMCSALSQSTCQRYTTHGAAALGLVCLQGAPAGPSPSKMNQSPANTSKIAPGRLQLPCGNFKGGKSARSVPTQHCEPAQDSTPAHMEQLPCGSRARARIRVAASHLCINTVSWKQPDVQQALPPATHTSPTYLQQTYSICPGASARVPSGVRPQCTSLGSALPDNAETDRRHKPQLARRQQCSTHSAGHITSINAVHNSTRMWG